MVTKLVNCCVGCVHLSLPSQHAEKRADAWYPRFLSGEEGLKHVAINDEMQGGTNLTVVAMLHEFYLKLLPQHMSFEIDRFEPQPFPQN